MFTNSKSPFNPKPLRFFKRLLLVNLPTDHNYFANYDEPAKKNFYVAVRDSEQDKEILLGTWHLLPYYSFNGTIVNDTISNISRHTTVIYFHGAGEARSYCTKTYDVLRWFFHVIAFDYRGE